MTFHLLTCFFHKFFGSGEITELVYDLYQRLLFQFFHNGLVYKEIIDIEILLRATLKMEFGFSETLIPADFMNYFTRAMEIEDAKKQAMEKNNRS